MESPLWLKHNQGIVREAERFYNLNMYISV
jgi:hypothetical protein